MRGFFLGGGRGNCGLLALFYSGLNHEYKIEYSEHTHTHTPCWLLVQLNKCGVKSQH